MSSEFFECLKQHAPAGLLYGQGPDGKKASRTSQRDSGSWRDAQAATLQM